MPRRSRNKFEQDYQDVIGSRWEFLRRNKDYVEDFRRWCKNEIPDDFIIKKYLIVPLRPDVPYFEPIQNIKGYRKKFDKQIIKDPLDLIIYSCRLLVPGADCLNESTISDIISNNPKSSFKDSKKLMFWNNKEISKQNTINVEIFLNSPYSRIIKDVEDIVKKWQDARQKVLGKRDVRFRVDEYKLYLRVYDYYENEGLDFNAISRKLNKTPVLIKRYYKKCCELIDGGYKQIR